MAMNMWLVPPRPKNVADNKPVPADQAVIEPAADVIEPAPPAVDRKPAEPAADDGGQPIEAVRPARITLGSMDPQSGFFVLATLNNRGGTVERLELTERTAKGRLKYRRVDTPSGYLGYLATEASTKSDGCLVRVVGPGTPAALAKPSSSDGGEGLKPDDLIVAFNSQAISQPYELDALLTKTKPDDKVTIEVRRTESGENDAASAVKSLTFNVTLTEHPLDLIRLASTGGDDEVMGNLDRLACRVTLSQLGNKTIPTGKSSIDGLGWIGEAVYQSETKLAESHEATFTLPITAKQLDGFDSSGPLTIERSYTVAPASYLVAMDVAVRNNSDKPQKLAYRLEGPCGMTLEGWWYSVKISPNFFGGASARDVIYKTDREGHRLVSGYELLKRAKSHPEDPDLPIFAIDGDETARSLRYIGIDAQYFDVAYLPPADSESFRGFRRAAATLIASAPDIPRHKERAADVSFFLDSIALDVPAGARLHQPLRMFAGPKIPELIDSLGLSATIEYGWFGMVSKILGGILHFLYSVVGNYAIAIVMLTILVRGCLFPVSRKAAIHAQKMQELAPELKKINEKFKDDMEGKLKAQREFQKRVGFNPLAGCLPALLQLPIFIGLYRCLSVDIELRQATFVSSWQWASNLAGPDMFYYWGDWLMDYFAGRGTGWLGPYFNLLPILVVILFLVQQKMFMPPATDEQQEFTQKVMTIMTLMMALFFFRVPAGLCIYFITSSLWGIVERIVVKKTIPQAKLVAVGGDVIDGTVIGTSKPAKESLADRIRKQIKPEPPKALPPGKRKKPPGGR